MIKIEEKKISLIIPVYNTEDLLPRCLESVLNQTYNNLEIIIVNDCSKGDTDKVVKTYERSDSRIKYIKHERNLGLFQARITGSIKASGDYIAFVDSDDFVAIDLYRMMVRKAEKEQADLVLSKVIMHRETDSQQYIFPFNEPSDNAILKNEIFDSYMKWGRFQFYRPIIWNKLISKELWDKAFLFFKEVNENFISFEDVLFSTVLSFFAKKMVSIDYKGIYYSQNENASTAITKDVAKYERTIKHIGFAMQKVKEFLYKVRAYEEYANYYNEWLKREFNIWTWNIKKARINLFAKRKINKLIRNKFGSFEYDINKLAKYNLMYSSVIPFDNHQGIARNGIIEHEYISFSLFDCLITLPILEDDDIYSWLDEYFPPTLFNCRISELRKTAKNLLIESNKILKPHYECVDIEEIYEFICDEYFIDKNLIKKVVEKEKQIFIEMSSIRKATYELYEMAKHLDKKIIITVDTSLDRETVKKLLKNKKIEYEKLFIKGELKTEKNEIYFYKNILDELDIENYELYNIGSNCEDDSVVLDELKIENCLVHPCNKLFLNQVENKKTSGLAQSLYHNRKDVASIKSSNDLLGLSSILGIISNKFFDNPFLEYAEGSDFNGNPYYIGYFAVGMMVLGSMKWLVEACEKENIKKIAFSSKHDKTFKFVFDLLVEQFETDSKSISLEKESEHDAVFSVKNEYQQVLNYCIHSDDEHCDKTKSYYKSKPIIVGELREKFTETYSYNGSIDEYVNKEVIRGIQDFALDACQKFGKQLRKFVLKQEDMVFAFDKLLLTPVSYDMKLFADSIVYRQKMTNIWGAGETTISYSGAESNFTEVPDFLVGVSRWKKAIFYYFFDRKVLKEKVRIRFHNKPVILKIMVVIYRVFRRIKRMVMKK